jgi:branched-chain amino acid transport system ATP-binding protein
VTVQFDGLRALDDVHLQLARGEILGLIGPNGAGKTTLVNVLSGFQRPSAGDLVLDGRAVTGRSAHRLARSGVARTFQAVRPFGRLSVAENIALGSLGVAAWTGTARSSVERLLGLLRLEHHRDTLAADLPHGDERRLGIARALAGHPRFLLLDEPAAGLDDHESAELVEDLRRVRELYGCALLVIEHDMQVIMRLCERIQVVDEGRTISEGTPSEVRRDPLVIEAYLGRTEATVAHG